MSEGTEGTAFFSVQNDFAKTTEDFAALEAAVSRSLGAIRSQFTSFQGVEFNPLDKVYDKVNQQAGLIERRLQDLFRKYEDLARKGRTPAQPFSLAANDIITRSAQQVDKAVVSQAPQLADADLALLRRTLAQGLADGATAAARSLQSALRAAVREAGGDERALAGSANSLRPAVVARPILQGVPDSQSAADYVAATRAATRARQDAARASSDAAAADRRAAKVTTDAAAKSKAAPEPATKPVTAQPSAPPVPAAAPAAEQASGPSRDRQQRAVDEAAAADERAAQASEAAATGADQATRASGDAAAASQEATRAQHAAATATRGRADADEAAARATREAAERDRNPSVLSGLVTDRIDRSVTVRQLPQSPVITPALEPAPATDSGDTERATANARAARAATDAAAADEQDAAATREAAQLKRAATRRKAAAEAAATPTAATPEPAAAPALASNEQRLADAERQLGEAAQATEQAIGAQREALVAKAAAAAVLVARIQELITAERDLRSTAAATTTILERQARATGPTPPTPSPRPTAPAAPAPAPTPAPTPAPAAPQPPIATETSVADVAAANEQAARAARDAAAANERAAAGESADQESAGKLQAARAALIAALTGAIRRAQELGATSLPAASPARPTNPGLAQAEDHAAALTERAAQSAAAAAAANELARRATLDAANADADSAGAARERANALRSAARVAQLTAAADARAAQEAQRDLAAIAGPRPNAPADTALERAPRPPAPPAPPAPPTPPGGAGGARPPGENPEDAGRRAGEVIEGAASKAVGDFIAALRARLEAGEARYINSGASIFDPNGPLNQGGKAPIINANTLEPEPPGLRTDRLMQQVDAEIQQVNAKVAALEAQITRGELVALNARVATQPLDHPDDQRTFISRQTAEPVDLQGGQAAINDATRALAEARRKQTVAADQEARQAQLLAEIEAGTAQFLDRARRVAIRTTAPVGEDIVNARTAKPLPVPEADQLRRELQDQIARIRLTQAGVDNGSLVALNSRLATQAPGTVSDADRTIVDRATGQVVNDLQRTGDGLRLYDQVIRKAAADTRQAADRAAVEQRISAGDLLALNARFATRPPTQPEIRTVTTGETPPVDTRRQEVFDRTTGQLVQDEAQVEKALQLLAEVYRKAALGDLSELIREAEERVRRELLALAEDVAAKRRRGEGPDTDTGVQFGSNNTIIDTRRGGTPSVVQVTPNQVQQLDADRDAAAAKSLRATRDRVAAAEADRTAQLEREQQAALRERARAEQAASRSGVTNNFLQGLTSGGFSGNGENGLDGLARAAGQTAKYSTLYQTLNLLRQGLTATIQGFLDADDSITEYDIAAGHAGSVTADFQNTLESIAQTSGFNVGEALDVAAKGVRAFRDEIDTTGRSSQQVEEDFNRLGEGFARQASRLATLSKTTLEDAAGNLTAVASGFNLPKNEAGFSQVTDAIAGAKLAGGGDETQIFQGLANAAVTFKSLGFSLNESATILSKINAQTDESGTVIATRLSRLTSVLNGNAARNFIQSLNQQLPQGEKIDVTASQRDQLLQLSAAFQKLGESQKGALISALGGTAEERELSVLLQNLQGIVKEADNIKPGAGLKEFQERLTNVRAQLKEIQGFIQAIIVNFTTSGLADPIIELVGALKVALEAVSFLTQEFKKLSDVLSVTIGGQDVHLVTLITNLGALTLALKGLQAIRNAGGLRGVLSGAEAIVAPTRAVARQQLAGAAPAPPTTTGAGGVGAPIAGIQGRAAAAIARVDTLAPVGVAADADVREAGTRVRQAAERLARAEEEQAAVISRQTEERRALRANAGSNGDALGALSQRQEQERLQAAQAGVGAQLDLATAQAELARAERVQAAQAEVAAQFDARRTALSNSFERQIGRAQGAGTRAFQSGDQRGLDVAMAREVQLRDEFNVKLGALEAERVVAEQRATAITNASRATRAADSVTFGGVSAARVAREEGQGLLGTAGAFSSTAIRGIGSGIASLFKIFGPVGIGLTALDFGFQVKGAVDDINKARQDLRDIDAKLLQGSDLSPQSLKGQADSEAAAAENLRQASSGLVGGIADLFTDGRGGAGDAQVAQNASEALKRAAETEAAQEQQILRDQTSRSAAASTLNVSSPQALKDSFDALQGAGYNASQSMDLLITRIGQLRLVVASTADLTATEQARLANSAGAVAPTLIGQLTPTERQDQGSFSVNPYGATEIHKIDPASVIDSRAVQDRVAKTVQQQLKAGVDVGSKQGEAQLEQALIKGYQDLVPDAGQAAQLAHKIADFVYSKANNFATQVNTVADLQVAVQQGIAAADAAASRAQTQSQLKSLTTGSSPDTSQLAGANTRLTSLQRLKAQAEAKLADLKAAGETDDTGIQNDLVALNDKIDEARVQQLQAVIADAQQQLATNQRIRQHKQAAAKGKAQIAAIGRAAFTKDAKVAIGTLDVNTILSVFDDASQTQINAVIAELEDARKAVQAKLAVDRKTAQVIAAARAQMAVLGNGGFSGGITNALQGVANAADQLVGSAQDDILSKQIDAAKKASQQAVPNDNYLTGKDALSKSGNKSTATAAQIAAANAQAKAVRDRNSIEAAQAAVQAAKADLAAAKDQQSKAQALQQLYSAENALSDALKGVAVARRFAGINPNDSIANARKAVAEARADLSKYARGTLEWYQALTQLQAAQQQLSDGLRQLSIARKFVNLNPNDSVGNARKAIAEAQAELSKSAKGSLEYFQALAQLHAAQQQLADGLAQLSVARRFVNAFPASQVQSAAKALAEAKAELSKYAKGSLEYYQALAQLVQAQREVANAQNEAYFLKQKLNTDLTDPVAQARLAVREAEAKLRILQREGAPKDLIDQAKLDVKDAQNQAESAAFSQRLQDVQTNEQLGRISHEAYLRYLENEHNRLVAIRHRTRQQQDELNQVDLAIKAANDQFTGQFNIGDIKVPTIYEVRRAVANQTGRDSVVANSQVSTTNNNNVTINGADFQKVVEYLKSIIGPQGASRITPIARKG